MEILFYMASFGLAVVAIAGGPRWILPIMAGTAFGTLLTLQLQGLL